MTRLLKLSQGDIKLLAEEMGMSTKQISFALRGAVMSWKCRKARALAIVKYNAKMLKEVEITPEEFLKAKAILEEE